MLAFEIMSEEVLALNLSDSAQGALSWMEIFRLSHLPVVDNGVFIGLLSDIAIYDSGLFDETIYDLTDRLLNISVTRCTHIFEIIDICHKYSLTSIPVVNSEKEYQGVITLANLLKCFATVVNADIVGGVIIIEMHINDYSLSQIAHIVESNDAKIVSMYAKTKPDSMKLSITIKLNTCELTSIIRTFERYDYDIKATFEEQDTMKEILKERYNSLMNYLNI